MPPTVLLRAMKRLRAVLIHDQVDIALAVLTSWPCRGTCLAARRFGDQPMLSQAEPGQSVCLGAEQRVPVVDTMSPRSQCV
jgi:hypothetical protein